jgi:hypothetical protein
LLYLLGLDKGIDQLDDLLTGLRPQFLDLPNPALQSAAEQYCLNGLDPQQGIGADIQFLRQVHQHIGRGMLTLGLVVGNHPARCADLIGQLLLGIPGSLAQLGQSLAKVAQLFIDLLGHMQTSLHGMSNSVSPVFVHQGCTPIVLNLDCPVIVQTIVTKINGKKILQRS